MRQYAAQQSRQHAESIKRGLKLTTHKLGNPNAAKAILPFNKIKSENSIMFALLLQPVVTKFRQQGLSQRKIVDALNNAGIMAPEGGNWVLSQLQKVLKRIDANDLALSVNDTITNHQYQEYSASQLITAFEEHNFLPKNINLDEETVKTAQERNASINHVLELYQFMRSHGDFINNYVTQGYSLNNIAIELNNKSLTIPTTLFDTNEQENQTTWNEELVEKLLKRLDNRIHWHIESPAVSELLTALEEYSTTGFNTEQASQNPADTHTDTQAVYKLYNNQHGLLEQLAKDFTGN